MNNIRNTLIAALLLCAAAATPAQEVIRLWDGLSKPYYKENSLREREVTVWGTLTVTDITEPTITLYRAQGRNSGAAVLIIPGGNYEVVAIHHEGYDVARVVSRQGITAAVLKYRLPSTRTSDEPGKVPLSDARRALKILHQQAGSYGINPGKIGIMGFSAGGHLAAVSTLWKSADPEENVNFSAFVYGVTNDSVENMKWLADSLYYRPLTGEEKTNNRLLNLVTRDTPPAFLVHALDDQTCPPEESTFYFQKLQALKVPVEMHLFPRGGHGFGLGHSEDGTDQWVNLFINWVGRLQRK